MAVTGTANGESILYLIDPAVQYVSAYRTDGRHLTLFAGRDIRHDHPSGILAWYEGRAQELRPEEMQEKAEAARKELARKQARRK